MTRLEELYRPIESRLEDLTCPTFVGWGDQDPFFSVTHGQRTAEAAGTTLRLYSGAGHFLPHERPAEVAADIIELGSMSSRSQSLGTGTSDSDRG